MASSWSPTSESEQTPRSIHINLDDLDTVKNAGFVDNNIYYNAN